MSYKQCERLGKRCFSGIRAGRPAIVAALLALFAGSSLAAAQTYTQIASILQGVDAEGSLVQGLDGQLYGTANQGGDYACNNGGGCGALFKVSTTGVFTSLYVFCAQTNCTDGAFPVGGLLLAADGNFYGTTVGGGQYGFGVAFRLTAGGKYSVLHHFTGTDGTGSSAPLIQVGGGALYGTGGGGVNQAGSVYKLTLKGVISTVYSFCSQAGCADGSEANGVTEGTDGNLYGVTVFKGVLGYGTAFKLTPSGKLTTLHSFNGTTDGIAPNGPLFRAMDGSFYGTTFQGGDYSCFGGCGTSFRVTSRGQFSSHEFAPLGGQDSLAPLVQATDGNFYGTTTMAHISGNVFELSSTNLITSLFDNGCYPSAGLLQATDGKLYGTTAEGGSNMGGTVFSVDLSLAPFVITVPTSRKVGTAVTILGTNLTGASSVTFNGVPAAFTVVSATQITTTVPAGAATGSVVVVTPSGTLTSNMPFRVM